MDEFTFVNLIVPEDPWSQEFQIYVNTTDRSKLGMHDVHLKVSLLNYPNVAAIETVFVLTINEAPNNLPFFEPKLAASATIIMTHEPEPWSMQLPAIKDHDILDKITLTANFGYAANFVALEGKEYISITDISKGGKTPIRKGMFLMTFTIDDSRDKVNVPFALFVIDPDDYSYDQDE